VGIWDWDCHCRVLIFGCFTPRTGDVLQSTIDPQSSISIRNLNPQSQSAIDTLNPQSTIAQIRNPQPPIRNELTCPS
jgi:hypothetical protein